MQTPRVFYISRPTRFALPTSYAQNIRDHFGIRKIEIETARLEFDRATARARARETRGVEKTLSAPPESYRCAASPADGISMGSVSRINA